MQSLDEIISETTDVREVKRGLSVKLLQNSLSATAVSEVLKVSVQYVSKWKVKYEAEGAKRLGIGLCGP
ncbi:MAG: helix-turn-helix domain-containing protein [Aggregatilineales bacterium]